MFDKISSSITYLLMVGNRVDPSGNNITGMQITKQALKTGIDIVNRNGLDLLGENSENLTAGQLALKEIYEKLDQPGIKDRIAASVQALTTKAKEIEDENTENADGDEESEADTGFCRFPIGLYMSIRFPLYPRQPPIGTPPLGAVKLRYWPSYVK